MFHIALFEPEIAPNTGNIIRLCANTGARLHLIEPLGFELDNKRLRRAGLDYHELTRFQTHHCYDSMLDEIDHGQIYAFTTKGETIHSEVSFSEGDVLLFGPETRGLPETLLDRFTASHKIRIPMVENSRSINLANAVAISIFEGWRQLGFEGQQKVPLNP